jgi:hypothetical protein
MSKPARMFRTSVPSQIILQKIFELLDQEQWTDQGVISRWPGDANRIARLEGVIGSATNWPEPFVYKSWGRPLPPFLEIFSARRSNENEGWPVLFGHAGKLGCPICVDQSRLRRYLLIEWFCLTAMAFFVLLYLTKGGCFLISCPDPDGSWWCAVIDRWRVRIV